MGKPSLKAHYRKTWSDLTALAIYILGQARGCLNYLIYQIGTLIWLTGKRAVAGINRFHFHTKGLFRELSLRRRRQCLVSLADDISFGDFNIRRNVVNGDLKSILRVGLKRVEESLSFCVGKVIVEMILGSVLQGNKMTLGGRTLEGRLRVSI